MVLLKDEILVIEVYHKEKWQNLAVCINPRSNPSLVKCDNLRQRIKSTLHIIEMVFTSSTGNF